MEPEAENITGEVVERHEFQHHVSHSVNWSHVLLTLVILFAIVKLASTYPKDDDERRV